MNQYYAKLTWHLIYVWLIVDSITGLFINKGIHLPISQVYKLSLIGLILPQIVNKKSHVIIIAILLVYFGFFIITHGVNNYILSESIAPLLKPVLTLFVYLFFKVYIQHHDDIEFEIKSKCLVYISIIILGANVLLGSLGYGFATYESVEGSTKGFFAAGNELGGILICVLPLFIYYIKQKSAWYTYIICITCVLIGSILIGTKTVILSAILSVLFVNFVYGTRQIKIIIILSASVSIIAIIFLLQKILNDTESVLLERWSYAYRAGGFERLILSGRDLFWEKTQLLFYNSDLLTQLFGMGSDITVERDQYDSLIRNGYIGRLLLYSLFGYFLFTSFVRRHLNTVMPIVIFVNITILIISSIAGHIMYSGMASLFIALINSYSLIKIPQTGQNAHTYSI